MDINKGAIGSFASDVYGSSSDVGMSSAWNQSFNNGDLDNNVKTITYCVRPVRAF
jgi:hypothetical protein